MDVKKGIFMGRKSMSGGAAFPVHVRRMNWNRGDSDGQSVFCEHDPCMTYMNITWRSGMQAAVCPHLPNVWQQDQYTRKMLLSLRMIYMIYQTAVLTKY